MGWYEITQYPGSQGHDMTDTLMSKKGETSLKMVNSMCSFPILTKAGKLSSVRIILQDNPCQAFSSLVKYLMS